MMKHLNQSIWSFLMTTFMSNFWNDIWPYWLCVPRYVNVCSLLLLVFVWPWFRDILCRCYCRLSLSLSSGWITVEYLLMMKHLNQSIWSFWWLHSCPISETILMFYGFCLVFPWTCPCLVSSCFPCPCLVFFLLVSCLRLIVIKTRDVYSLLWLVIHNFYLLSIP